MASFDSAVRAVEASLAIQRQLADTELRVRIGINAGEPIAEDGDFFGEMALLDDAPRNAGIKAVTPTVTLSLGRDQFRDLLAGSPQTAASVQAVARARAAANRT